MPKSKSKVISPKSRAQSIKSKTVEKPKNRQIKQPAYKSFRISKRIRNPKSLPGSFRLFRQSIRQLTQHWRLFGGIMLVYLFLNIILVKGLGVSGDIAGLKEVLEELFEGNGGQLLTSLTLFTVLLSSAGSTPSEVAGAYQTMTLVLTSLALIWALRQTQATSTLKLTVRSAFYTGMYPLVPFLLVLLVIGLQLVPLVIGGFLYTTIFSGGLAGSALEQVLWYMLIGSFVILSFYMVLSSVFALYIVTLPDFKPLQALRTARLRVLHRRTKVLAKLVFLPIMLLILSAILVVPVIMLLPEVAEWWFYVVSVMTLAVIHSYMYNLYRELIRE